jgi:excisionase family DNA binding protein
VKAGSAKDVALMLGCSLNRVYELAASGEIPTLRRFDSRVRFDLEEVERWAKERAR